MADDVKRLLWLDKMDLVKGHIGFLIHKNDPQNKQTPNNSDDKTSQIRQYASDFLFNHHDYSGSKEAITITIHALKNIPENACPPLYIQEKIVINDIKKDFYDTPLGKKVRKTFQNHTIDIKNLEKTT